MDSHQDTKNFLGINNLSTASLTSMTYDPLSKLLLLTTSASPLSTSSTEDLTLLTIEPNLTDFVAFKPDHHHLSISPAEKLLGLKQGHLYVQHTQTQAVRRISVTADVKERAEERRSAKREEEISEKDILGMQIEEASVSVTDIRRYEKLMSGKAVLATSNATNMMCEEKTDKSNNRRRMYTKHHWTID